MLICKECKISPICTIKADMTKHLMYADISIQRCEFNKTETIDQSVSLTDFRQRTMDPMTGRPLVNRDKINELSNKNREEKRLVEIANTPETKISLTAVALELDHKCPGCSATTFKEDASNCEKCGKDVCSCCATTDGDTKELLCPECWQAL